LVSPQGRSEGGSRPVVARGYPRLAAGLRIALPWQSSPGREVTEIGRRPRPGSRVPLRLNTGRRVARGGQSTAVDGRKPWQAGGSCVPMFFCWSAREEALKQWGASRIRPIRRTWTSSLALPRGLGSPGALQLGRLGLIRRSSILPLPEDPLMWHLGPGRTGRWQQAHLNFLMRG